MELQYNNSSGLYLNPDTTYPPTTTPAISSYNASEIISIIALSILFILGTVGNFLVLFVFAWKKRKSRKPFEMLLAILGVVDMFASMVIPVLFLYGTVTKYRQWHFGYIGCKIISSLFPASVTISQGILVLISYERYKSVKDPFDEPLKKSFIALWLFVTLLVALLLVSPYIHVLELVTSEFYSINTCAPSSKNYDIFLLYSCGNFFRDFAATSVMIALGIMTTRILKKTTGFNAEMTRQTRRQRNTEKARKMLIVVVCVFSFCVIPLDLYQVVVYTLFKINYAFSAKSYNEVLLLNTILTILQVANCTTNVIIYSRMHKDFTRQLFSNARSTFRNISRMMSGYWSERDPHSRHSELLRRETVRLHKTDDDSKATQTI